MQTSILKKSLHDYDKMVQSKDWAHVLKEELNMLNPVFEHFCPFRCLFLGYTDQALITERSSMVYATHANLASFPSDVLVDYNVLPFPTNTFDLVVCPHIHELPVDQSLLFQEFQRVLVPEGLLVVLGLNPSGVLQIRNYAGMGCTYAWAKQTSYPKPLIDQLSARSFEFVYNQYGMHKTGLDYTFSSSLCAKWLPSTGGVYKLVFRYREKTPVYVGMAEAAC